MVDHALAPSSAPDRAAPRRGHLRVVDAPTFSAVPHGLILDPRAKHGHIVTYAVLQMHWWQGGECWAGHATLAVEAKCSVRQLQRYIRDLVAWGFVAARKRGLGQAQAYAPTQHDVHGAFNTTPVSPCESNTTPVSEQHDIGVAFNTTPVSEQRRRTEEDSSGRKKTTRGGGAAVAAPAPAPALKVKPQPSPKAPKLTAAPTPPEHDGPLMHKIRAFMADHVAAEVAKGAG